MSIRIIPQDELGSSEKRTADYIPPLLFPRLKNLYNRRAERLRELAENNPLGDFLRFAALIAHAQEVVLYDHPLQMDLTARIKEANAQGKPPLDIHVLPRDKHWHKLLHSLIAELKPEMVPRWRSSRIWKKPPSRSWKRWQARCLLPTSRWSAAIKRRLSGLRCRSTGRKWPA
jgi:formate dehydrogenase accessory protein FdhE